MLGEGRSRYNEKNYFHEFLKFALKKVDLCIAGEDSDLDQGRGGKRKDWENCNISSSSEIN